MMSQRVVFGNYRILFFMLSLKNVALTHQTTMFFQILNSLEIFVTPY